MSENQANGFEVSGVIPTERKKIIFYAKDFKFRFMTDGTYFNLGNDNEIATQNGKYLYGYTHTNHNIAILFGNEKRRLHPYLDLISNAYIISSGNVNPDKLDYFDGIEFVNGSIKKVFVPNAINIEDKKISYNDDSINGTWEYKDQKIRYEVCSNVREKRGLDGNFLENSNVSLRFLFDEPQGLEKWEDYNSLLTTFLSFLLYRKNVGFEEINLLKKHEESSYTKTASVIIRKEKPLTEKSFVHSINLRSIENQIPKLFEVCADWTDKNYINIAFCPSSDKELALFTGDMVKEICTALEHEFNICSKDYVLPDNDILSDFKKCITDAIDEYQRAHKNSQVTMYKSNVGNWGKTEADKILAQFHFYEKQLNHIKHRLNIEICEEDINAFVKYRNGLTHGRNTIMTEKIMETGLILIGLIYCCILRRIGVDMNTISELCENIILI